MPAVLVETGFISNPEEEDYLNSEEGQQEICEVIVKALKRYKYSLEKHFWVNTTLPQQNQVTARPGN
jgi:N-acetylmuramoyl-L-alanine amidase